MIPIDLKTSDFDYDLPQSLIAQTPTNKRDESRLMVLNRKEKTIEHRLFKDIIDYLMPEDLLVLNDTKVMPANLIGKKADGTARIEVLLVQRWKPATKSRCGNRDKRRGFQKWTCLVKPGKRLKIGSKIVFSGKLTGTIREKLESGEQVIEFIGELQGFMREHGEIPLPPYIKVANSPPQSPSLIKRGGSPKGGGELIARYQTVYAEKEGASAAPTAGLHFTSELLDQIKAKGVNIAKITLHTGLGTFKPVYAEYIKDHKMFEEEYEVSAETIRAISRCNIGMKRVIAVGTTSVRTLETIYPHLHLPLIKGENERGSTDIFIYPGFKFQIVDAMITNFHIPRSTLLMLVSAFAQNASADKSAFAGRDFIFRAYKEAIDKEYRFFSFGDAMLII
ncbi:tRNA preQ1(34) S-adenosylmethionine ribosyltransferase-isomerase QueA [Candidatus Saganbacteria bacterium]|nr:tRNA preQ1(34) S-adenosylmethionine ribosyltransferase-isomerase QueA [Candidatus Saganbacteria bacterium]